MKLRVQYMDSKWSTESTMTTIDIENVLDNPIKGVKKEDLPMWNFWNNETSKRDSRNCTGLNALFLDYDGTLRIEDFQHKYYIYKYYLYTTMGHTEQNHKFRVIIPFMSVVSTDEYTPSVRKALEEKFPECDPTAFYKDHFFFLPAVPENGKYTYKINYANCFNPKILTTAAIVIMSETKTRREYQSAHPADIIARQEEVVPRKIAEILTRTDGTGRYHDLLRLCWGAYRNGVNSRILEYALSGYKNKQQIMNSLR